MATSLQQNVGATVFVQPASVYHQRIIFVSKTIIQIMCYVKTNLETCCSIIQVAYLSDTNNLLFSLEKWKTVHPIETLKIHPTTSSFISFKTNRGRVQSAAEILKTNKQTKTTQRAMDRQKYFFTIIISQKRLKQSNLFHDECHQQPLPPKRFRDYHQNNFGL